MAMLRILQSNKNFKDIVKSKNEELLAKTSLFSDFLLNKNPRRFLCKPNAGQSFWEAKYIYKIYTSLEISSIYLILSSRVFFPILIKHFILR